MALTSSVTPWVLIACTKEVRIPIAPGQDPIVPCRFSDQHGSYHRPALSVQLTRSARLRVSRVTLASSGCCGGISRFSPASSISRTTRRWTGSTRKSVGRLAGLGALDTIEVPEGHPGIDLAHGQCIAIR